MIFSNSQRLAEWAEVDKSTISRWVDEGCPYEFGAGMCYQFDLDGVLSWLEQKGKRHARYAKLLRKRALKES